MVQKYLFIVACFFVMVCMTFQPCCSMEQPSDIPDDIYTHRVFPYLNQRDIPSVVYTCKKWMQCMENQDLWKGYAERAFVLQKGIQLKDYKAGVKYYCTPSFEDLGEAKCKLADYVGESGEARQYISYDGLVYAGSAVVPAVDYIALPYSHSTPTKAVRWVADEPEFLGGPDERGYSRSHGINCDGTVIVGGAMHSADLDELSGLDFFITKGKELLTSVGAPANKVMWKAFEWSRETGMVLLDCLEDWVESEAFCVNYDGSVIVGTAKNTQDQKILFRKIRGSPIESLGNVLGCRDITPRSVNFDGSVIVGGAWDYPDRTFESFIWAAGKGMDPFEGANITAHAVNLNGAVIVGSNSRYNGEHIYKTFRFSENKMEYLNDSGAGARAINVSYDGSLITCHRYGGGDPYNLCRWTPKNRFQFIEPILDERLIPVDWRLDKATLISANGIVVYGVGNKRVQLEDGKYKNLIRGFRAIIPTGNLF